MYGKHRTPHRLSSLRPLIVFCGAFLITLAAGLFFVLGGGKKDPVPSPAPENPTPPTPAERKPATAFRDGLFHVGKDVQPGKYVTKGGSGELTQGCYWARRKSPKKPALASIIDNGLVSGPAFLKLPEGEYVEAVGGCVWALER